MSLCHSRRLCLQPLAASGGKPHVSKRARAKARKQAEASNGTADRQQAVPAQPQPEELPVASSSSSQPEAQPEAAEEGKSAGVLQYVIWIAALLGAIGVFYGVVFAASGSIAEFLSTRMTFTRKDFIPYEQRRMMEAELEAREREAAVQTGTERQSLGDTSPQMLYELLPKGGK